MEAAPWQDEHAIDEIGERKVVADVDTSSCTRLLNHCLTLNVKKSREKRMKKKERKK